jgi:heme/copper-type cytochrome/quinol oxidase subunit 2
MNMLKKILIALMLIVTPIYLAPQAIVLADSKSVIQGGINDANGGAQPKSKTLDDTIATAINLLSVFAGIIAVIMIIVGGFRYITSAGNPEAAKSARNTILYAIIGLVVVAMAQVIAKFVLNKTT